MTDRALLALAARALYGDRWQTHLAELVGVTPRAVRMWAHGDRRASRRALVSLREALEAHSGELKKIAKKLPRQ